MLKAGHLGLDPLTVPHIDRSDRLANGRAGVGEDGAPGIDHQGVAMGLAAGAVLTGLGWGDNIGRVLNRPRLQQNVPVVFARKGGEGGGNKEQIGQGALQP